MGIPELKLMLKAIGACFGIIGAAKIYVSWSSGKKDIERDVLLWAGGLVFLFLIHAYFSLFF